MDDLLSTAREAAEEAASVHRSHFGRVDVRSASRKGRSDFVSRVDMEAQEACVAVIRARHPGHFIVAEEAREVGAGEGKPQEVGAGEGKPREVGADEEKPRGAEEARGGEAAQEAALDAALQAKTPVWVVDPLDGTTNFLHGHPAHASSVGVWVGDGFAAGAVAASHTGERWWARRGGGAYRDGERIQVSAVRDPANALVGTGFPFKTIDLLPGYLEQLGSVLSRTAGIRRGGSAALDLCYLASGILDAFWEMRLSPWDVGAGIAIVLEAGGVVTRLDGSAPGLGGGPILAANSPELHAFLGALVAPGDEGRG